jgi:hypothetical protein
MVTLFVSPAGSVVAEAEFFPFDEQAVTNSAVIINAEIDFKYFII